MKSSFRGVLFAGCWEKCRATKFRQCELFAICRLSQESSKPQVCLRAPEASYWIFAISVRQRRNFGYGPRPVPLRASQLRLFPATIVRRGVQILQRRFAKSLPFAIAQPNGQRMGGGDELG